jgi:hypothetical protein
MNAEDSTTRVNDVITKCVESLKNVQTERDTLALVSKQYFKQLPVYDHCAVLTTSSNTACMYLFVCL